MAAHAGGGPFVVMKIRIDDGGEIRMNAEDKSLTD